LALPSCEGRAPPEREGDVTEAVAVFAAVAERTAETLAIVPARPTTVEE